MKTDKILHLVAGYAITLTIGLWWPVIGLAAGILAGAAKELIYDMAMKRGTPDWWDFIFTVCGVNVAFSLSSIIHAQ